MSKFVTLVLEPRFDDEYGEYANMPVFNAHGDIVGYTGGEVPETGNPCEFYVMDGEGFPACHSASENLQLRQQLADVTESMGRVEERLAKMRELAKKLKTCNSSCGRCIELYGICEHETELQALGIEVDG